MTKTLFRTATLALLAAATAAQGAMPTLYEEAYAREEERKIIQTPIAGIYNSPWYDYRIDVTEAQKELASDLRGADDIEDRRDAWEEYATELFKERRDYIQTMAKMGYRQGQVTVGG